MMRLRMETPERLTERDFDDGVSSERGMRRIDNFYTICLFRFLLFRQTEYCTGPHPLAPSPLLGEGG